MIFWVKFTNKTIEYIYIFEKPAIFGKLKQSFYRLVSVKLSIINHLFRQNEKGDNDSLIDEISFLSAKLKVREN